jgi:hypothetical protein
MKLPDFRTVGEETWADLKTDGKMIWDEVKAAIRSAVSKFK